MKCDASPTLPLPGPPPTVLSQEENSLGRFLKEQGKEDKTRAGKMMVAVGKTMSYTAQQRLALRSPLLRLHQVGEHRGTLSELVSEHQHMGQI